MLNSILIVTVEQHFNIKLYYVIVYIYVHVYNSEQV